LPLTTKLLIAGYKFTKVILIIIGLLIACVLVTRTKKTVWDKLKLKTPFYNRVLKTAISARFCATMSDLLARNVTVPESLSLIKDSIGNEQVKTEISRAEQKVNSGKSLAEALTELTVFDATFHWMMLSAEKEGNQDKILFDLSRYYNDRLQSELQTMVSLMEPVLLILVGILVGYIFISVYSPVFGLFDIMELD
jgi:type IV pilus assembly protein PilC